MIPILKGDHSASLACTIINILGSMNTSSDQWSYYLIIIDLQTVFDLMLQMREEICV
jgi:hypothetical protein